MCSGIPLKLLNFSDLTKFLVLNFHAKHHIFNGLDTWLLGAVNKLSKNNRSIDLKNYTYIDFLFDTTKVIGGLSKYFGTIKFLQFFE